MASPANFPVLIPIDPITHVGGDPKDSQRRKLSHLHVVTSLDPAVATTAGHLTVLHRAPKPRQRHTGKRLMSWTRGDVPCNSANSSAHKHLQIIPLSSLP